MSRKNTEAWNMIHSLCAMDHIDEKQMYEKARMLLKIYRKVCWSAMERAYRVSEELYDCCGSDLEGTLVYLEEFAPEKEREKFEFQIKTLFETRWLAELIEHTMIKVRDFPENGTLYHEILSKCFLSKCRYTENELLEILHLERSRFYDRKKEAVMVFGLSLWRSSIPNLKSYMAAKEKMDRYMDDDNAQVHL